MAGHRSHFMSPHYLTKTVWIAKKMVGSAQAKTPWLFQLNLRKRLLYLGECCRVRAMRPDLHDSSKPRLFSSKRREGWGGSTASSLLQDKEMMQSSRVKQRSSKQQPWHGREPRGLNWTCALGRRDVIRALACQNKEEPGNLDIHFQFIKLHNCMPWILLRIQKKVRENVKTFRW